MTSHPLHVAFKVVVVNWVVEEPLSHHRGMLVLHINTWISNFTFCARTGQMWVIFFPCSLIWHHRCCGLSIWWFWRLIGTFRVWVGKASMWISTMQVFFSVITSWAIRLIRLIWFTLRYPLIGMHCADVCCSTMLRYKGFQAMRTKNVI